MVPSCLCRGIVVEEQRCAGLPEVQTPHEKVVCEPSGAGRRAWRALTLLLGTTVLRAADLAASPPRHGAVGQYLGPHHPAPAAGEARGLGSICCQPVLLPPLGGISQPQACKEQLHAQHDLSQYLV